MGRLPKLRAWINRDNGRFYRVGNTSLGPLSIIGGLAIVASLVLSQLHSHVGLHRGWAIVVGIVGLVVWFLGDFFYDRHDDT